MRIVERFTMTVDAPPPGRDAWFLDYVLRSPQSAGRHLTAGWLALNRVQELYPDVASAEEWFGGMGAQGLMVQDLFPIRPGAHYVGEFDRDAVRHLHRVMPDGVNVGFRDAYVPAPAPRVDLHVLDFGDLTAWKTREGERHHDLLDRVFAAHPRAVVLTDIACRYLHLHRERYETLLGPGTCGSYEDYLYALADRIEGLWDYSLADGWMDRWSTVMVLVPKSENVLGIFQPTPDSPVGLEVF
jgi:hypothetical protein